VGDIFIALEVCYTRDFDGGLTPVIAFRFPIPGGWYTDKPFSGAPGEPPATKKAESWRAFLAGPGHSQRVRRRV